MLDAELTEINRLHGFTFVKQSRKNGYLWEQHGVRLRTSVMEAKGFGVLCETILPYNPEILPFILPRTDRPAAEILLDSGHIFKMEKAPDLETYRRIVGEAGQLAALSKDESTLEKMSQILLQFPAIQYSPGQPDPQNLEHFSLFLERFRIVQVKATLHTLSVYIQALGIQQAYLINPGYVASAKLEGMKFIDSMKELAAISGMLIACDLAVLLEDKPLYKAVISYSERLHFSPEYLGARLVLYHAGDGRLEDNPLPTLALPDIAAAACLPYLEAAGLQPRASTLSALTGLLQAEYSPEEAVLRIRDAERLQPDDHSVGESLRLDHRPEAVSRKEKGYFQEVVATVRKMMSEYVVGHGALQQELIRTVCGWFLLGVRQPLIMAFCGPPGVGKNYLCEVLARICQFFFNTPQAHYVPFEAPSIVSHTSLWQLTGVQSGLVGAEAAGILELLKNGSVLCFNEVDKLEPGSIFPGWLVSLLDKGSFRNGHGRLMTLPRCLIVLTMNAGATADLEKISAFGFKPQSDPNIVSKHYKEAYGKIMHPALRSRISNQVYFFDYLSPEDLREIGRRELGKMQEKFHHLGFPLEMENIEELASGLAAEADPLLGARQILKGVEAVRNSAFRTCCQEPHD